MLKLLKDRIQALNSVGQDAFEGSDFTFGFETWRGGTITLLKEIVPNHKDLIAQIENIKLYRVDMDRIDALAYNLEACKKQAKEILQTYVDVKEQIEQSKLDTPFWGLLHPKVQELARPRFESGFYADSIVQCLREANSIIKKYVKTKTGEELDGASLMTKAFSVNNPIIPLADLSNENGRNIQLGYMKLFEGAMIGIRNPKSHENMTPNERTTIHLLFNASFIFVKLEETGVIKSK